MWFKKFTYYADLILQEISPFTIHIVSLLFIELYQYFNTNIDS